MSALRLAALTLATCAIAGTIIYGVGGIWRGYTFAGMTLGIAASIAVLFVAFYSARKRPLQELVGGRMRTWLAWHVIAGTGLVALVLFHAGGHFDGRSGTWLAVGLAVALLSGFWGTVAYATVPRKVYEKVRNLSIDATRSKLKELEQRAAIMGATGSPPDGHGRTGTEAEDLQKHLGKQIRLRRWMRGWLWVHVPASLFSVMLLGLHVWDAMELGPIVRGQQPSDAHDPRACASCHPRQFQEWASSMMAIAQMSPVTDVQNRAVLKREAADKQAGRITPPVGSACVRCHAPTGYVGEEQKHESPLADIADRTPASQLGVSCVACHNITSIDRLPGHPDPEMPEQRNALNYRWSLGREMLGPIPASGPASFVGNSYHRGSHRSHFGSSEMCASCHTVTLESPGAPKGFVKLQDTYREWNCTVPGEACPLNWSKAGVECMHCHNADLGKIADSIKRASRGSDLATLRRKVMEMLTSNTLPEHEVYAAEPADGFDKPLTPRRRFRHTFTGVDYHLEDGMPFAPGDPLAFMNAELKKQNIERSDELLKMAAALRIERLLPNGDLEVRIANLATGHHLPAGFAFAREMWVEVAIDRGDGKGMRKVIGGGSGGQQIKPCESLDVNEPGLRNFRTVLFGGAGIGPVALQNEAADVLAGGRAKANGFKDREQPLLPGEDRVLRLPIGHAIDVTLSVSIRVRLLFRNYAPDFLQQLARAAAAQGDAKGAKRILDACNKLRIVEMAADERVIGRRVAQAGLQLR